MTEVQDFIHLREAFRAQKTKKPIPSGFLLTFVGLPEGKDAYNPSGPFLYNDEIYLWVRVESHDAQDAVAVLFKEGEKGNYHIVPDVATLPLEDPFITMIGNEYIVGGVEIEKNDLQQVIGYRTVFYKGTILEDLHPFAVGPAGMKDIRFAELPMKDGQQQILTFTRPYIPLGARMMGRIAVTTLHSFEEISPERLAVEFTELLPDQFSDTEWGGVNDVYVFQDSHVGVLCHVAMFDEKGKRHYAAAAFTVNTNTGIASPLVMIAERGDFPMGPIKVMSENLDKPDMQDDLADVVFSSRLFAPEGTIETAETLELTCGLSDAAAGTITIQNPFPALLKSY